MNIKHFNFSLLTLVSLLFGLTCFGIVKADVKYTTVETLEDYCCTDDSYVNENMPNANYGDLEFWYQEYSTSNTRIPFFKFNLTNKPNNIISSEVILTCIPYKFIIPAIISNNSWTEESITWNNQPPSAYEQLPYEMVYIPYSSSIHYHINTSDYLSSEIISLICLSPEEDGYITGLSKESPISGSEPKILWTYEVEHVIEETYDLMGDIIVGSIGFGIGFVVTSALFIGLRRRKK